MPQHHAERLGSNGDPSRAVPATAGRRDHHGLVRTEQSARTTAATWPPGAPIGTYLQPRLAVVDVVDVGSGFRRGCVISSGVTDVIHADLRLLCRLSRDSRLAGAFYEDMSTTWRSCSRRTFSWPLELSALSAHQSDLIVGEVRGAEVSLGRVPYVVAATVGNARWRAGVVIVVSKLFSPLRLRDLTLANRVWVSPMCQYSSVDGRPTDWHLVHLGSLARGGAGLVMTEATAVSPEGRISPNDAGIWTDEQADDYRRMTDFIHAMGSAAGIQLAHAGRKASTDVPWEGRSWVPPDRGGWETVGPSSIGYGDWPAPRALDDEGIAGVVADFTAAARRAEVAGFDTVEVHAAHGYLLHQFLSPLTNTRSDAYGGDLEGRSRLLLEVAQAVRSSWPAQKPVMVRLSATDWSPGGWDLEDTVKVADALRQVGVDLIDVSSGGNVPEQQIAIGPGYQVAFARAVRERAGIATAAVGLLSEPVQAEQVLVEGAADAVFLARALLRDPHWPQRAAAELGDPIPAPKQYGRAWGR